MQKDKQQLYEKWKRFIEKGEMDSRLDFFIQTSWTRSKKSGVNAFRRSGSVAEKQLKKALKEKSLLIEVSLPLMESLYAIVEGSGFVVILCDETGMLLKVIGDEETIREAEKMSFVEGASWNERELGTNAIGTAIVEGQPLQVYAHEHYCAACHAWTCSAAPILRENGDIIGVLNMSGPFDKVNPHTLGMVVSAVKAIEIHLQLLEKSKKNEMMKRYLEATTNTLTDGLLIIDKNGRIVKINGALQKIAGMNEEEMTGKMVASIFQNRIFDDVLEGRARAGDKEIRLHINGREERKHVLLGMQPIAGNIGWLIQFKEIQQVRQFVNAMTGSQAKITFQEIIGRSPAFMTQIQEAKQAAMTDANVLLLGESGTGKDVFAQAIHNAGERRHKPFIAINCGAIPRDLLGSELFGYEEGAFTGARKGGSPGKFELADGGTIFLDEVGEMSLEMQVVLLRVLQTKEVIRIGGHRVLPVNVRIIAATNKKLKEEVRNETFREDLFYRLNVIPIRILPLRERKEDIPLLANYFAGECSRRMGKKIDSLSPAVNEVLCEYEWRGNVRELQNILERSIHKTAGPVLEVNTLPAEIFHRYTIEHSTPLKPAMKKEEWKKQALLQALSLHENNCSRAAKSLGISRSTLYRQMEQFHLK
jgi:PAS domain S-box-containing protein